MNEQELLEDYLKGVFWQRQYPVYSLAGKFGCNEQTITNLADRHGVKTFKCNGTRFIARDEIIKMLLSPGADLQKYLERIRKSD
jgi:hypothetical protein